jgi:uncharacterized protein involved in exopolysaccharide biosynthesis
MGADDDLRIGSVVRAGWWLVLLGTALGVTGGLLFTALRAERLESTVEVSVEPQSGSTPIPGLSNDVSLDTEARLVVSDAVLQRASRELPGRPSTSELRDDLSLAAIPGSRVLEITYTAGSAPQSVIRVRAVAQAYLQDRTATVRRSQRAENARIRDQLEQAERDLAGVARPVAAGGDGTVTAERRGILVNRINTLAAQRDEVERFTPAISRVLREPSQPREPGPGDRPIVLGAGLIGTLLGFGAALAWARSRNRIAGAPA